MLTLSLFSAAFLVMGMSASVVNTTLTLLASRYDIAAQNAGLFVTLQTTGATAINFLIGYLLDRVNSRLVCWLGPGLLAAGLLGLHISTQPWMALASIVIYGLGFGTTLISGNVIVARLNADSATARLNLLNLFFGLGGMIGPQIVAAALNAQAFTLAYVVVGLLAAALTPFFWGVAIAPPPARSVESQLRWLPLAAATAPFIVLMFLYTGAEIGFSSWIFTQLSLAARLVPADATLGVSLFWVGLTVGRLLASLLARYLADESLMVGAAVLMVAGAVLLLLLPAHGLIGLASSFIVGLGAGPMFPTAFAVINRRYPQAAGLISSLLLAASGGGAALLPWLQGQVGRGLDGGIAVTLVAAFGLLLITVFIWQRRHTASALPA